MPLLLLSFLFSCGAFTPQGYLFLPVLTGYRAVSGAGSDEILFVKLQNKNFRRFVSIQFYHCSISPLFLLLIAGVVLCGISVEVLVTYACV